MALTPCDEITSLRRDYLPAPVQLPGGLLAANKPRSARVLWPCPVPDLHGPIIAGAGEPLAVGAEGHAGDGLRVPSEDEGFLAADGVPDPHRLVIAGARKALAVGAEGHAVDTFGRPLEGKRLLAAGGVPDTYRLVA